MPRVSLLVRWLHVLRTRLVHATGLRFRTVGWAAIAVLVVTGLLNLWMHPVLLSSPRFHWKVGLVVLAIVALGLSLFR